MPIVCVPRECGVLVFVLKVYFTRILLAIDSMLIAGGAVG